MRTRSLLPLLSALIFSAGAMFGALNELDDYEAALAQAAKENKFVLLDFTGSDWCPPCKMMAKEVFASDEFAKFADKNLVFVKLDFAPDGAKPGKFQKQNDYLAQRFQIDAFPTFVVLTPKGTPVGSTKGYMQGGPSAFIEWVEGVKAKSN